jgi:hypothetical protein
MGDALVTALESALSKAGEGEESPFALLVLSNFQLLAAAKPKIVETFSRQLRIMV